MSTVLWRCLVPALIVGLLLLIVFGDLVRRPTRHTTTPTYDRAARAWWAGEEMYNRDEHAGFLYFPQAAILYSPFTLLPDVGGLSLGGLAWRLAVLALYFYALLRLVPTLSGRFSWAAFWLLVVLAVPSALASLRNAQFDLPLAALIVLTASAAAQARWNGATFWLCLAVALKPLAVVPLLLFGALFRPLWLRLPTGLLLVFALPFFHWSPTFVWREYAHCVETLAWATKANEPRYSDLAALLSQVDLVLPDLLKTVLRLVAALGTLALGWVAVRRLSRPRAAWLIGALAATYLMLFNPRTETCSFVMLGVFLASLAVADGRPWHWPSFLLAFAALALACDALPILHGLTDRWLKPLIALICVPLWIILARRPELWPRASTEPPPACANSRS